VLLQGEDATRLPPYERDVNTVFQDYALFPHMTVAENVGYGPRVRGVSRAVRTRRAGELLEMVGLSGLGGRGRRSSRADSGSGWLWRGR
jgi:ABC-type Fe3+/spermidine/putrescine transport system ATPase subunit